MWYSRGPGPLVTAGVFWACFDTSPEEWYGPGMFRRDELRRAGTCGVDVGFGHSLPVARVRTEWSDIRGRCPTGRFQGLETFLGGLLRKIQNSLTNSNLSTHRRPPQHVRRRARWHRC